METDPIDLLIIGAGMSGLMLATSLVAGGDTRTILLVDKGRSVGGRLATRRLDGGRADHGAQFFTVRDQQFQDYVDSWLDNDLVFPWATGWSNGSIDDENQSSQADGHPRYAVRGGMNALAKYLAGRLQAQPNVAIHTGIRVDALHATADGWFAEISEGERIHAAAVVVTTPVPQALDLFYPGGTRLADNDRNALESVAYAPCLCGLYVVDGAVDLPEPGAIQQPNAPISWIADNQRKGISPERRIITVHAGPELSRTLYDATDADVEPLLRDALEPFLATASTIADAQVKRWRYALPVSLYPERFLEAQGLPSLFFGGDAFGGPRVEGAALSGLALADRLRAVR